MKFLHPHKSIFPFPRAKQTFVSRFSYLAATVAAGSVIDALNAVYKEKLVDSVFCAVRPPGHHCHHAKAHGFCLFNNVGIGCKYALKECSVKKVLVLDWDIHHGDGTQSLFYSSNQVLYFSIHRFDPKFFPETGKASDTGANEQAKGFNINVPVNTVRDGRTQYVHPIDYMQIMTQIFFPILLQFKPDLVMISAGYDSCKGDPIGQTFLLTPEVYGWIISVIRKAGFKNIVTVLEGGYDFKNLADCVETTVEAMVSDHPKLFAEQMQKQIFDQGEKGKKIGKHIHETIEQVKEIQKHYWKFD